MKKRRDNGEVRVMIGVPHYSGGLDISEAGPIPESAGVIVRRRSTAAKPLRKPAVRKKSRAS
ncbi:MAG: hypothetical protein WD646_04310 [Actinomycetota bacterium]